MMPAEAIAGFQLFEGSAIGRFLARWPRLAAAAGSAPRRACFLAAVAWAPLALLAYIDGRATAGVAVPFFADLGVQVRFLLALPLLVLAEGYAHRVITPMLGAFISRDVVGVPDRPRFKAILAAATRANLSLWALALLVVIVMIIGRQIWTWASALPESTWYGEAGATVTGWTPAGRWLAWVSIPLFQFLLIRWYCRLVLWAILLARVARLPLRLVAIHPDGAGGIGFLDNRIYAFGPLLIAHGCLYAGVIGNRILQGNGSLPDYRYEIAGAAIVIACLVLGPYTTFFPRLWALKHEGRSAFSSLANRYVQEFDARWISGTKPTGESLVGSPDIQSLADLGNSYDVVRHMRLLPFTTKSAAKVAAWILAPLLPLTLTMFSVEDVVRRLVKLLL